VGVIQPALGESVQEIEVHRNVVSLGVERTFAVDRGVGRTRLGGDVEHRIGLMGFEQLQHEVTIREIALDQTQVLDGLEPFFGLLDPCCRHATGLGDPFASRKVVDTDDPLVELVRESQRSWPAEVSISTGKQYSHRYSECE